VAEARTCECGCGTIVPKRFVKGHNNRLRTLNANPRWRGDNAGRSAIHKWLNKHWPLTGTCEQCGTSGVRTEWSNKDHTWRRERDDYRELCSRCHRYYDYLKLGTPNPRLDRALFHLAH
jgi:hypothetical protein